MTKKMISLTLALALILSTALIPAAAGAENSSWIMYVYTDNGRTLKKEEVETDHIYLYPNMNAAAQPASSAG